MSRLGKIRREVQVFDGKLEAVSPILVSQLRMVHMTIVPRLFPLSVQERIIHHREPRAAGPSHRGSHIAQVPQPTGSAA